MYSTIIKDWCTNGGFDLSICVYRWGVSEGIAAQGIKPWWTTRGLLLAALRFSDHRCQELNDVQGALLFPGQRREPVVGDVVDILAGAG